MGGTCHTRHCLSRTVRPGVPCSCAPPQHASPRKHRRQKRSVHGVQGKRRAPPSLCRTCLVRNNPVRYLSKEEFLMGLSSLHKENVGPRNVRVEEMTSIFIILDDPSSCAALACCWSNSVTKRLVNDRQAFTEELYPNPGLLILTTTTTASTLFFCLNYDQKVKWLIKKSGIYWLLYKFQDWQ